MGSSRKWERFTILGRNKSRFQWILSWFTTLVVLNHFSSTQVIMLISQVFLACAMSRAIRMLRNLSVTGTLKQLFHSHCCSFRIAGTLTVLVLARTQLMFCSNQKGLGGYSVSPKVIFQGWGKGSASGQAAWQREQLGLFGGENLCVNGLFLVQSIISIVAVIINFKKSPCSFQ